jgi:hypothetical protein
LFAVHGAFVAEFRRVRNREGGEGRETQRVLSKFTCNAHYLVFPYGDDDHIRNGRMHCTIGTKVG